MTKKQKGDINLSPIPCGVYFAIRGTLAYFSEIISDLC